MRTGRSKTRSCAVRRAREISVRGRSALSRQYAGRAARNRS
jgi:hypothetical protein